MEGAQVAITCSNLTIETLKQAVKYVQFKVLIVKVNESRYKQHGVTQHFSTGHNLFKKNIEKK